MTQIKSNFVSSNLKIQFKKDNTSNLCTLSSEPACVTLEI